MSDKKDRDQRSLQEPTEVGDRWREFWILPRAEFTKLNGEKYWQALNQKPAIHGQDIHVIEHAAYEAEKQRADILENYNEVNSGLAKARKKAIYDLEKEKAEAIERSYELHKKDRAENQKLKEALAISEGQEQKLRQALEGLVDHHDIWASGQLHPCDAMRRTEEVIDIARKALNE